MAKLGTFLTGLALGAVAGVVVRGVSTSSPLNGRSKGKSILDFDINQVRIGTRHELEHTKDSKVAQRIAMDHLAEDPDYYRKLRKVGL